MIRTPRTAVASCLGCVCALAALAWLAQDVHWFEQLDAHALERLSRFRYHHPAWRAAWEDVAILGDPVPQVALLVAACLAAVRWRAPRGLIIAVVVLVAGADATTQILKIALSDPGPQKLFLYRPEGTETFPSGHATAMLSMALAWLMVVPRSWRWPVAAVSVVGVTAVGLAVVFLHRHHPSDVFGGLLVASAWFFGVETVLACVGVRGGESR